MKDFGEISAVGSAITPSLFGGNVLSYRNELDAETGYSAAIDDLGVTDLRFPGGSLTEYYFDINNPDSDIGIHSETGQVKPLIPLSDFLNFAEENGHTVTIVVPTRHFMSDDRDDNGDRYARIDEAELRDYIRDVVSGQYGNAEITALEIGNEYWHSGDMSAVEYGRVASEMVRIVDSEIEALSGEYPNAERIDIIVQIGQNNGTGELDALATGQSSTEIVEHFETAYGLELDDDAIYSGGQVNYANIANEMILSELETSGAIEAVDGVVAHIYSHGDDQAGSRTFLLNQIEATWREDYPQLETYVTEWNLKGSTDFLEEHEDFGLHQAAEMLNIVEEFANYGVASANVWPLIQVTDNALSTKGVYGETNAPGAMFEMMSGNLPGKTLLDLNVNDASKTEAEFDAMTVHGFADKSELLFYVASNHEDGVVSTNLDIRNLVADFGLIEIRILGVEEGTKAGSNESPAFIETVDASSEIREGFIDIPLDPGEIAQIIVQDYEFSDAYEGVLDSVEDNTFLDTFDTVALSDLDEDPDDDDDTAVDSSGGGAFDWLLSLLPLAGLLGLG